MACNPITSSENDTFEGEGDDIIEVPSLTSMEGKHCFLGTVTHDNMIISKGDTILFIDSTIVNLEVAGTRVTGTMDWLPAEQDGARGTLTGTIDGNTATVLYSYTIEGSDQQEEKIFEIRENELAVKVGELEEDESGGLKMKNPAKAIYGEIIPRVPCD